MELAGPDEDDSVTSIVVIVPVSSLSRSAASRVVKPSLAETGVGSGRQRRDCRAGGRPDASVAGGDRHLERSDAVVDALDDHVAGVRPGGSVLVVTVGLVEQGRDLETITVERRSIRPGAGDR